MRMRKLLLMMALFMSVMSYGQTAYEKAKILDNTYVGVEGGVSTPLNFNSVFPINSIAGLKVGKDITPIIGLEAEGQVFFNDNNVGCWTSTFVKGTNVSLNGTINLLKQQIFGIKTNTGLGWLHQWNSNNYLSAKTALDFTFNLNQANSIVITPGVWWNLNGNNKVQFNKNLAQFGVFASYVYHFKTSNGTHTFKAYDIAALNGEINSLRSQLNKKPKTIVKEIVKVNKKYINPTTYIFFAKNSTILTPTSKLALDAIKGKVDIIATASPEGTVEYNQTLSEQRAQVVADYLTNRGVTVNSVKGIGVTDETSNRVAIITATY